MSLSDWVDELSAALEIDVDVDEDLVLDIARDAAHGVERKAAPVTTFLLGYAVARYGDTSAEDLAARVRGLLERRKPR